jgi:hypothetical protein
MKVITVLSFILCLLMPLDIHADQIIKDSKILNEHNIKIFIGEKNDNSIVLHSRDNLNMMGSFFLLSPGAPYALIGKIFEGTLLRECGDQVPGIGFYNDGHSGFLVASGEKVKDIIRWYPANSIREPMNNTCVKHIDTTNNAKISYFSTENQSEIIYQVKWKRVYSDTEVREACQEMAEWNIVKLKRSKGDTIESFTEKCIAQEWACKEEYYNVVGLLNNDICRNIITSVTDCNGKVEKGSRLREFLGLLEFYDGMNKETWFLWDAPGYEGDGIYVVEKKNLFKKRKKYEGWLVYNGC